MVKITISCWLLLMSFAMLYGKTHSFAKNGTLDLSHADWSQLQSYELKGEWEFFWHDYVSLQTQNLQKKDGLRPDHIIVPGFWTSYAGAPDNDGLGHATYHLQVILPPQIVKKELLAIKINEIASSYLIWLDKRLVGGNGIPGINKESTIPLLYPQIISFIPQRDTLDITIMVANYHYRVGGFMGAISLGSAPVIINQDLFKLSLEAFLAGTLFMIGIYHLTIYFFRRKEKSSFWFALICLTMSIRTLSVGENFVCRFAPWLGWELQNKIEYLTLFLTVPFFIRFIYTLFPERMSVRINLFSYFFSCCFIVLTLSAPARIYGTLNYIFQIGVFAVIVYLIIVLTKSIISKDGGASVILAGFVILSITTINDIFYNRNMFESFPMATLGTFFFILSQALLLSNKYAKSFIAVEELSERLYNSFQDLKNSQDLMVKQEKLASLGTLTAGIAHEINNPAQAIKFSMSALELNVNDLEQLISELMKISELTPAETVSFCQSLPQMLKNLDVDQILAEIRSTVSDNLGALKRIEKIVQSTKRFAITDNLISRCNLNELVQESLILVSNQLKNDLQVKTQLANDLPVFWGYESEISQILINLVQNAHDAIKENGLLPKDGLIEIETNFNHSDNSLILKIRDNGCGIYKKHLNKIFDPFFTTKVIGKGTGLGLNVVHRLVTHHNGKITVTSQKKHGTEFTVIFPNNQQPSDTV